MQGSLEGWGEPFCSQKELVFPPPASQNFQSGSEDDRGRTQTGMIHLAYCQQKTFQTKLVMQGPEDKKDGSNSKQFLPLVTDVGVGGVAAEFIIWFCFILFC